MMEPDSEVAYTVCLAKVILRTASSAATVESRDTFWELFEQPRLASGLEILFSIN